ncbi:MAG: hypothetical protein D6692_02415 [Planctomycetota bacterium]|nr:MAG: hypothetical protein D6692_02415 [Planctomycetota bacterium]
MSEIPSPARPEPLHPEAARAIRRHARGVARADDTPYDCRFIYDGQVGEIVLAIDRAALDADELVLFLPDDTFDAEATLLIHPRACNEDHWTDRHLAYHPDFRPPVWARAAIDAAKLRDGTVVPSEGLALTNPLLSTEPALCKLLNADRSRLRALVKLMTGVETEHPTAVGVDRFGIDVRARFGLVRLELPAPCEDPDEARRVIDTLIKGAA